MEEEKEHEKVVEEVVKRLVENNLYKNGGRIISSLLNILCL